MADLQRQLKQAHEEFDALYKQASNRIKKTKGGLITEVIEEADSNTSVRQIATLLGSVAGKTWTYDEIMERLPNIPRSSIRVFLYHLQEEDKVEKVGRGKWKAK